MAGQRCTANRRVIVSSRLRAKLLDRLTRATAQLIAGTADDPATHIGPLVSAAAWDRVTAQIQRAEADGLVIHRPLPAPSSPIESWCPPVIIECDDPPHEIVQQESFGPVLVIQTCRDWDHAIALANGVSQGLASALFSESSDRITDFLDRAQAGILKVNQSTADAAIDQPFGGWKGSGMGPPEHGDADIAFFTRMQTVYGQPPRPA